VNDVSIEKLRDHFIICGYGQVGRRLVDPLKCLQIPFVLIETNEGLCRKLLKEKVLRIQVMASATTCCSPPESSGREGVHCDRQ